ncbi:MAG: S41 family peptidase [Candidatus Nanopelagicaceae bacterium]|nr:S41 family peptidase [Candidatus Nanopelagicaceae bacterium]
MSKKSGGQTGVGKQRKKALESSKPKTKTANFEGRKKTSKVSSSTSSIGKVQEKPAVIRGNSSTTETPTGLWPVKPESKFFLSDQLRRISILAICSTLLFGIGVQVGKSSNGTLVDNAIDKVLETGAQELDRKVLERAAISGVLKATGDEWANYFPKSALEVLQEQNSNTFTGIGVWLTKTRSGQIKISSIQDDSPAAKSGILPGDQILEINGTDVRGASLTSVVSIIRGSTGKRIELLVARGEKKVLASLSAKKIVARSVEATQVAKGVALLEIANFAQGTTQEVKVALQNLNFNSGVIIDLRDNPGGLIEEAVGVSELFINRGVIVSYQVNDNERVFTAKNSSPIKSPVVVIVNRNTASSAEILAGAFQDRNRGVVIGERTYGKGSVQEFVTLSDGSRIELTVALFRTPSGRAIEEFGITPDLEVIDSQVGLKALQVLGGLAALVSQK